MTSWRPPQHFFGKAILLFLFWKAFHCSYHMYLYLNLWQIIHPMFDFAFQRPNPEPQHLISLEAQALSNENLLSIWRFIYSRIVGIWACFLVQLFIGVIWNGLRHIVIVSQPTMGWWVARNFKAWC